MHIYRTSDWYRLRPLVLRFLLPSLGTVRLRLFLFGFGSEPLPHACRYISQKESNTTELGQPILRGEGTLWRIDYRSPAAPSGERTWQRGRLTGLRRIEGLRQGSCPDVARVSRHRAPSRRSGTLFALPLSRNRDGGIRQRARRRARSIPPP